MVRKKLPNNKLGIQADHVIKPEKRFPNFKPISSQHPDIKNRGSSLKKKMKKSSSSSSIRKNALVRTDHGSPNYMKSTRCFDARKEQPQVSSLSSSWSKKIPDQKNSKRSEHGFIFVHQPAKSLTRLSSSLKVCRTLTKTPSFKPTRVSLKKSCSSLKATCSSTLKDSKFPEYLVLTPGGTESEGISAIKVCPYTYCSLNGHLRKHSSLPPLKCFISAKRRSLKTQKSMKLEALIPSKVKPPHGDEMEEVKVEKVVFYEKGEHKKLDFFMEVYNIKREDVQLENHKGNDNVSSNYGEIEAVTTDYNSEKHDLKSISDGSPKSEMDLGEEIIEGSVLHCWSEFEKENNDDDDVSSENNKLDDHSIEFDDMDNHLIKLDDEFDSRCTVEFLADEVPQEGYGDSAGSESEIELGDFESDGNQDWEMEEISQVFDIFSYDQLTSTENSIENSNSIKDKEEKARTESPIPLRVEPIGVENQENRISDSENVDTEIEPNLEVTETNHITEATGEVSNLHPTGDHDLLNSLAAYEICTKSPELIGIGSEEEQGIENNDTTENVNANPSMLDNHLTTEAQEQQLPSSDENRKGAVRSKRLSNGSDEPRKFNPREPNYLPLVPDPDAEKVDLRHQDMDDKKNAEEWMLDYALQQAVTKLAPARKRKVALLVEAFETVIPTSKYETHLINASKAFAQQKPIQACF